MYSVNAVSSSTARFNRITKRPNHQALYFVLIITVLLPTFQVMLSTTVTDRYEGTTATEKPRTKVFYLKMFRAASSTIQNVFFRYGDARNLTFVLPREGHMLGYPRPFEPSFALPLPSAFSRQYDMFVNHARWNERSLNILFPNGVISITSIRNPVGMIPSLYDYFGMRSRYSIPLSKFMENPSLYTRRKKMNWFTRNPMAVEFSIPSNVCENGTLFTRRLMQINDTFALVMLAERLEESMVLLREIFRWSWNDVVFFRTNERCDCSPRTLVDESLSRRIQKWNAVDLALYKYFEMEFERKKRVYGLTKFRTDVDFLKRLNHQWYKHCVIGTDIAPRCRCGSNGTISSSDSEALLYSRTVRKDDLNCQKLGLHEMHYTQILRKKLWPNLTRTE